MLKTFEKYLIKLFLKKILTMSLIFLSLILILSVFEEINFFKELNLHFTYPFFMTLLNAPVTLLEIFPFIFLLSTQFFFIELIEKNEIGVLKTNGIDNFKVIKLLSLTSFILGLLLIVFFYNFSSKLKFLYLDIKNNYSKDNKYLAVITNNGLWIKDEIDEKIYIIKAAVIQKNKLRQVSINEFDKNFNLIRLIESEEVDISNLEWIIYKPKISKNNKTQILKMNMNLITHFDIQKIYGMFRNLTSLNIFELFKLRSDYKSLGYSTLEIESHLHKLAAFPLYVSIMTLLSSILMFNIKRDTSMIFHIIIGIFLSVLIYYFYFLSNLIGQSEKIPLYASVWLPLGLLVIFIFIGLIRINEK